jgi:hypothetical protein
MPPPIPQTLTFINHRPQQRIITGLGSLVDCGDSFTVPAQGSMSCGILPQAAAGTYEYSSPCCKQEQNPFNYLPVDCVI